MHTTETEQKAELITTAKTERFLGHLLRPIKPAIVNATDTEPKATPRLIKEL